MNNLLKLLQPKDYKSKIRLYCKDCIADFPQKVKTQQENRNKVINICEIQK
jgi:hypothetical protein